MHTHRHAHTRHTESTHSGGVTGSTWIVPRHGMGWGLRVEGRGGGLVLVTVAMRSGLVLWRVGRSRSVLGAMGRRTW